MVKSIIIDEETHKKLKIVSTMEGKSIGEYIKEFVSIRYIEYENKLFNEKIKQK